MKQLWNRINIAIGLPSFFIKQFRNYEVSEWLRIFSWQFSFEETSSRTKMTLQIKQYDVTLLKNVVQVFGWLGVFPVSHIFLIVVFILCSLTEIIGCFLVSLHLLDSSAFSVIGKFIFSIDVQTMTSYNLVCLKEAWFHKSLWNDMFNDFEAFDHKIGRQKGLMQESIWNVYLPILLGLTIGLFCQILAYVHFLDGISYFVWVSYLYVASAQIFITTVVLGKIYSMFKRRLEFLRQKTFEVYSMDTTEQTFWNGKDLKDSHLLLIDICHKINKLFGLRILLTMISTFLNVLSCFQFGLMEDIVLDFTQILRIAL